MARIASIRKPRATSGERRATTRATSDEPPATRRSTSRESRTPISGCRLPSAVLAVFSCPVPRSLFPVPGRLPLQMTNDKGRMTVVPDVAFLHQVFHNGVCASVHVKSRRKPSNSCQNRSKRRRFPSKSDQKRAHFVMPILTFWGVTPSGASAKAVFAFQKGKKTRFGGAKWRPEKLSTISTKLSTISTRGFGGPQYRYSHPTAPLCAAGRSLPAWAGTRRSSRVFDRANAVSLRGGYGDPPRKSLSGAVVRIALSLAGISRRSCCAILRKLLRGRRVAVAAHPEVLQVQFHFRPAGVG